MKQKAERVGAFTHVGGRSENEDYVVTRVEAQHALLVVCDGMGGHKDGKIASELAANTFLNTFLERGTKNAETVLAEATDAALEALKQSSDENRGDAKMGTTVVAALVTGANVTIAHVGDSRAYQFRGRSVRRLTTDHLSVVEALGIPEPLAKGHANGHVLSQALGINQTVSPEISTHAFKRGDRLLLCTDGVSEALDLDVVYSLIRSGPARMCAEQIVRYAVAAGIKDNCTAAVAII